MSPKSRSEMYKFVRRGAFPGVAIGALSGAGIAADSAPSTNPGGRAKRILTGAAIGAGTGGALGGIIGARMHVHNRASDIYWAKRRRETNSYWRKARKNREESWKKWNEEADRWKDNFHGKGSSRPRPETDHTPHVKNLGLSGSEKTKAEVQQKYRDLAKKHHPDRGGNPQKMQEINRSMGELKKSTWFNKLSSAFVSGFEDICSQERTRMDLKEY